MITPTACLRPRHVGPVLARSLAIVGAALVAAAALAGAGAGARGKLPDVLDTQPPLRAAAAKSTYTGIAASGSTLVAVGPRGMILRSTDSGASWQQVASPVSADLSSVRFSGPDTVWAVGHDAVILKSVDRGSTWTRALDGRLLLKALQQAAAGNAGLAKEVAKTMAQSATADVWPSALLDLMFLDASRGFAVGAFGLLLATADGGKTWQPWMDHADNERQFHLYALSGDVQRPYIVGEQGLVLRLNEAGQRFERLETPYNGSFFGVSTAGAQVLAYGLRGSAYLSGDEGRNWRRIETGTDANIVAAALQATGLWLATQKGEILAGELSAAKLTVAASAPGSELYGAVAIDSGRIAAARLNGVSTIAVQLPR